MKMSIKVLKYHFCSGSIPVVAHCCAIFLFHLGCEILTPIPNEQQQRSSGWAINYSRTQPGPQSDTSSYRNIVLIILQQIKKLLSASSPPSENCVSQCYIALLSWPALWPAAIPAFLLASSSFTLRKAQCLSSSTTPPLSSPHHHI